MARLRLMHPPVLVREACCAGLLARSQFGVGGTARSVPFATKVCAGGPVTDDDVVDMLTHMAAIDSAMCERGLGDRALTIAWELWGGDPGREWAEQFLVRAAPVRVMAAAPAPPVEQVEPVTPVEPETPEWVAALNDLARAEQVLLARVHELMEAGVELALSRLKSKIVAALSKAPAALRAEFGGHRTATLAAMATATGPLEAVLLVPAPLLARVAPSVEGDATLRAVFGQLGERIAGLVAAHQEAVLEVLGAAGPVAVAEVRSTFRSDTAKALDREVDYLMGHVARLARGGRFDDEGETPTGKVPTSVAFRLISNAGGGDGHDPTRQDWVEVGRGEVLCVGIALGVTSMRALASALAAPIQAAPGTVTGRLKQRGSETAELELVTETTWRWGGAASPFPPHQRLNGRKWRTEQEREQVCSNPGRFPPVGTLYPGDHAGCSCSYEVELRMVQTEIGRVTVTLDIPPPVPTRDDGPLPPFKFDGAAAGPGAAQTRRMAEALNDQFVTGPAVEVTWTNKPGENWWGVTQLRTGQVQLNAAKIGDAEATTAAAKETFGPNPFFVANGQKVTKAEMALIHEWGHTMEDGTTFIANPTRSSETGPQPRLHKLYKELLADEPGLVDKPAWYDARDVEVLSPRIWPSQYAGTNADELMAEAFADWVINPDTAHVTSKRIAKELGWPKPKTPLAELSALSGSS